MDTAIFGTTLNLTEEMAIATSRTHPTMVKINTIAYILELSYYTMAVIFVPAYMVLSKFARRFHPLLRFQLRLFFVEMLTIILTRGIGVVIRLIEGASIPLPVVVAGIRDIFTVVNLAMVSQVDFSVFLIAMERLLATYKIKTYETSFHNPCYRFFILLYALVVPNVVSYLALLIYIDNMLFLNIWNCTTTCTHIFGFMAMELSQYLSKQQLKSQDRELSTSFQCKENIMVVRMFRPIFILFFVSRLVQFASKLYMFMIMYSWGAVALRIVTHLYNQSVGICFMLVPLMMLKNHSNLTRFTRQAAVVEEANGDLYFQTLMEKWK